MYYEAFSNEDDVISNFGITKDDVGVILFAVYEQNDYDGSAYVLFAKNGKLYCVEASHCSCYGLSGDYNGEQWQPDEMTIEVLKHVLENGSGYVLQRYENEFRDCLRVIEELGILDCDPEQAQCMLKLAF